MTYCARFWRISINFTKKIIETSVITLATCILAIQNAHFDENRNNRKLRKQQRRKNPKYDVHVLISRKKR